MFYVVCRTAMMLVGNALAQISLGRRFDGSLQGGKIDVVDRLGLRCPFVYVSCTLSFHANLMCCSVALAPDVTRSNGYARKSVGCSFKAERLALCMQGSARRARSMGGRERPRLMKLVVAVAKAQCSSWLNWLIH